VVSIQHSFHGRTIATITATAQPKYQDPFKQLVPGFTYVERNDVAELEAAVSDQTCAIIMEPIQGESGVFAMTPEFLKAARALADKHNALLIFDEVQCGFGRTGNWWAFQGHGIEPDLFSVAKSIAGGLPMGACIAKGRAATTLVPGDHASTFGANCVVAAAANAAMTAIEEDHLLENVREVGAYMAKSLADTLGDRVTEIRGYGMMLGLQLAEPKARAAMLSAFDKGLIVNAVGDSILRLLPPYITTKANVDEAVNILSEVI